MTEASRASGATTRTNPGDAESGGRDSSPLQLVADWLRALLGNQPAEDSVREAIEELIEPARRSTPTRVR